MEQERTTTERQTTERTGDTGEVQNSQTGDQNQNQSQAQADAEEQQRTQAEESQRNDGVSDTSTDDSGSNQNA